MIHTFDIWARIPQFAIEDGEVDAPRTEGSLECGLALQPSAILAGRAVQRVSGALKRVAHMTALMSDVPIVIVPGFEDEAMRQLETLGVITGVVMAEPYLWSDGPLRDSLPEGVRVWTVREVFQDSSASSGPVAHLSTDII